MFIRCLFSLVRTPVEKRALLIKKKRQKQMGLLEYILFAMSSAPLSACSSSQQRVLADAVEAAPLIVVVAAGDQNEQLANIDNRETYHISESKHSLNSTSTNNKLSEAKKSDVASQQQQQRADSNSNVPVGSIFDYLPSLKLTFLVGLLLMLCSVLTSSPVPYKGDSSSFQSHHDDIHKALKEHDEHVRQSTTTTTAAAAANSRAPPPK